MNNIPFKQIEFLFEEKKRGIIRMDYAEAQFLYNSVASLDNPNCVEIGRYQGGSTILMASAGARIISIDAHVFKHESGVFGKRLDDYLGIVLHLLGILDRVEIVVGNSQDYYNEKETVDLIFIDGDHTYEGVKADYYNWIDAVKVGGYVLFHDSGKARNIPEVRKFIKEIPLKYVDEVGSTTRFIKEK